MLLSTENGVALEVSNPGTILGAWRSLRDGLLSGEPDVGVIAAVSLVAFLLSTAQMLVERVTMQFVHSDVAVDGLVTDGGQEESAEPAADLLRTEVLTEPDLDEFPVGGAEALIASRV